MSRTIRITEENYIKLKDLAKKKGFSQQALISEILEKSSREQILAEANQAYDEAIKNPVLWQNEQEDRNELEATLLDGLDDE